MRKFHIAFLATLSLIHPSAIAADKTRRIFRSTGPWAMEYADNACRLIRNFADGEGEITLGLNRYNIGTTTQIGLAGASLRVLPKASRVKFKFAPENRAIESDFVRGQLADGRESVQILHGSWVSPERIAEINRNWHGAASLADVEKEDLAAASRMNALVISDGFKDEIELQLGPMTEPVKAMQSCVTDLFKGWGVDPQAIAGMSRSPKPLKEPETWLTIKDYPPGVPRSRTGVRVGLRLIVGPDGNVEDCHFEVEKPGPLELAACRLFKDRVRFKPALDATGQPMRSYWTEDFRFWPG